ncbi:MAG: hypothetical protein ACYDBQ_08260 [Thermoplasmatota archaeon]
MRFPWWIVAVGLVEGGFGALTMWVGVATWNAPPYHSRGEMDYGVIAWAILHDEAPYLVAVGVAALGAALLLVFAQGVAGCRWALVGHGASAASLLVWVGGTGATARILPPAVAVVLLGGITAWAKLRSAAKPPR